MGSKIINRIQENAEKLYDLRKLIAEKEEENKRDLEALKTERDAIQSGLISEMNKNGLASLKVKSGDTFTKSSRKSLEVVDELGALKWSIQNMAVSINKTIVAQKLKDIPEIPPFFKEIETEFISVRKGK